MFPLRVEMFLQVVVLLSIVAYIVELQVGSPTPTWAEVWKWTEITIATIFTVEYVGRIIASKHRLRYVTSWMGVVDLISLLPFYIGQLIDLRVLRLFRTLRIVRALKLQRFNASLSRFFLSFTKIESELKIIGTLLFLILFMSTALVHEAEREAQPDKFGDFGSSFWWAVVTMTTVGYGDSVPVTGLGRFVAGLTVVVGLIAFGVFTSVVGTAFLTTIQRNSVDITADSRAKLDRLIKLTGMHEQNVLDEALGYLEIIYDTEHRLEPTPFVQFDTTEQVCQRSL